jgi:hypothetical protein
LSKNAVLFIFQNNMIETLRLQVKPIQLSPIDRATPYFRTPVLAPRWGLVQANHNINHLAAGTGVRRQGLAVSIGPNRVGFT